MGFSEVLVPEAPQLTRTATTSTARRVLPNPFRLSRRIDRASYVHLPPLQIPEQQSGIIRHGCPAALHAQPPFVQWPLQHWASAVQARMWVRQHTPPAQSD
jgi:hypothetical protein